MEKVIDTLGARPWLELDLLDVSVDARLPIDEAAAALRVLVVDGRVIQKQGEPYGVYLLK